MVAIYISEELFGRIQEALSLAKGMASVHSPESRPELLSLSNELDDLWQTTREIV